MGEPSAPQSGADSASPSSQAASTSHSSLDSDSTEIPEKVRLESVAFITCLYIKYRGSIPFDIIAMLPKNDDLIDHLLQELEHSIILGLIDLFSLLSR